MKKYLTVALLLFSFASHSQIPIDSTIYFHYCGQENVVSVFHVKKYYKKGPIKELGWLVELNGWHDLHDPSEKYPEITMEVGHYKKFHKNGFLSYSKYVPLNAVDSIEIAYYDKTSRIPSLIIKRPHQKICSCKKDLNYTQYEKSFSNGVLLTEGERIIKGYKKTGSWTYYDNSGRPEKKVFYQKKKKPIVEYY